MFSKKILLSVIPGKLLIEVQNIYVGDTETIVVTLPKGSTGDISIDINGRTYTEYISNDTATTVFNIDGLSANTYTVEAIYGSLHATSDPFTVNKIPASMYNMTAGGKDIKKGRDERVTVIINGESFTGNFIDGRVVIIISDLPAGNYRDVYAYYDGDEKYMPSSVRVTPFTVEESKPTNPIS